MNSEEYIPSLLSSWASVHTLLISILNHFLLSLIVPIASGMIMLVIPSIYRRMSAAVRSEYMITIQLSWWFYLTAVIASLLLSLSLDDSRTTRCECLGRTRWSSPLDWTTYLYYFYKWLYTTSPRSYVLLECSTIT